MADDLNPKQQAFVREYLLDLNATQAAIRAGYSENSAHVTGPRLLANARVAAAIDAGKSDRAERTEINADWMLKRLEAEANADLADLYDESGALKPIHQWPLIWRQGLVAGVDVELLKAEGQVVGEIAKVKLSDRAKRIEMIGRHINVQAFQVNVKHSGDVGVVHTVADVAEADKIIERLAKAASERREA